jgi:hypothetical protein
MKMVVSPWMYQTTHNARTRITDLTRSRLEGLNEVTLIGFWELDMLQLSSGTPTDYLPTDEDAVHAPFVRAASQDFPILSIQCAAFAEAVRRRVQLEQVGGCEGWRSRAVASFYSRVNPCSSAR